MLPKKLSTGFRYTATSAFDNKIDILKGIATKDDVGRAGDYPVIASGVWASARPLLGRELERAQGRDSDVSVKVTIRYRAGIESSDLVVLNGRNLRVQYTMDPDEQKVELWLYCSEMNDGI